MEIVFADFCDPLEAGRTGRCVAEEKNLWPEDWGQENEGEERVGNYGFSAGAALDCCTSASMVAASPIRIAPNARSEAQ